jgi:NAD(P)-dependent dehydrogenase (short-subunit alcohol dehydrogenase family)
MATTFVITGSTKGIGFALARACVARGDNVVVSGRTDAAVQDAVARLQGSGAGKVAGLAADVGDRAQVEALWAEGVKRFGRVDVWINNAGVANTTRKIVDIDAAAVRTMVTTNMLGTIHGCQVAARGMVAQGGGRIFNILGGGSDGEYFPGMGVYGATKRGLDYLTRALVRELRDTPVLVGRVRPGMLVTEGVVREIKADPAGFQKSRRIMNALADLPDTVAPFLVERMLAMPKTGGKIAWLTGGKIAWRMMTMGLRKRPDLYREAAGL